MYINWFLYETQGVLCREDPSADVSVGFLPQHPWWLCWTALTQNSHEICLNWTSTIHQPCLKGNSDLMKMCCYWKNVSGCENIDLKLVYKLLLVTGGVTMQHMCTNTNFTQNILLKCWFFCSITISYCNSCNLSEEELKLETEQDNIFQNADFVQHILNLVATGLDLTFL